MRARAAVEVGRLQSEVRTAIGETVTAYRSMCFQAMSGSKRQLHMDAVVRPVRDLNYRFSSVAFHLHLMRENTDRHLAACAKGRNQKQILINVAHEQLYLLDDVVVGCVSMFDYWAGFAGTVLLGPGRGSKWNALHNLCGGTPPRLPDPRRKALRESRTAREVQCLQKDWVDSLMGYRSDMIHVAAEKPDARVVNHMTPNSPTLVELIIPLPSGLAKRLPLSGLGVTGREPNILDGAVALFERTHEAIIALATRLREDIA